MVILSFLKSQLVVVLHGTLRDELTCEKLKIYFQIFLTWSHKLIERNPPPGGVSYLLCSLIKNRV